MNNSETILEAFNQIEKLETQLINLGYTGEIIRRTLNLEEILYETYLQEINKK